MTTIMKDPIDQGRARQARLSPKLPEPMRMPLATQEGALNVHRAALEAGGSLGTAIIDTAVRSSQHTKDDWNRILTAMSAVTLEVGNKIAAGQVPVQIVRKDGQNYAVDGRFTELMEASQPVLVKRQEAHDANVRRIASNLEAMDTQLNDALVCSDTKADPALRSDVRNHLRSSENPAAVAMEAARLGDMQFIQTVMTTSPALMGLTQADVDAVRDLAKRARKPELYAAREAGQQVMDTMIGLSKAIDQKRLSISGYQAADKRMADEALAALRKPKSKDE
ncbi:MAG: hypothetical protein ABJN14_08530 [Paracoccaceae bacterium]